MINAGKISGFFAAHALWCIYDGEPLIPIYGYAKNTNEKEMLRLVVEDDLSKAVEIGKSKLLNNDEDAEDAVLIFDGRITLQTGKIDALIVQMKTYFSPNSDFVMAIPYTPRAANKFRVHRPKVLQWDGCDDFNLNAVLESFFNGVNEHEKGAKIWNDHLDESL